MPPAGPRLLVRELFPATEPEDYRRGNRGHMGLQAPFIHRCITRCRDQRLVYLAGHNHGGRNQVAFSDVDMASQERGYRALLDIAAGMPVGAVVIAEGAIEVDLWQPDGSRSAFESAGRCAERGPRGRLQRCAPRAPRGRLSALQPVDRSDEAR